MFDMAGCRITKRTFPMNDPIFEKPTTAYDYCEPWSWYNLKNEDFLAQNQLDVFGKDDDDFVNEEAMQEGMQGQRGRFYFQHHGMVYSIYRCITPRWTQWINQDIFKTPLDCAILLMSGGHFSGGIFKNGQLTHHKTFHRYVVRGGGRSQALHDKTKGCASSMGSTLRRYNERALCNDIATLLDNWKEALDKSPLVFLRCSPYHKELFFENRGIERKDSKYRSIPFMTSRPTLEEVKKTWERLTTVIEHGDIKNFTEEMLNYKEGKKKQTPWEIESESEVPSFVSPLRLERRAEKQRWPGIDPSQKISVHDAILANSYDLLKDVASRCDKMELSDYLSCPHKKLADQTFLHLAVRNELDDTVEFLLDFDCDPSIKDRNGRVPYQYCKSQEMKDIFKEFRATNPDRYTWTKCHVPEPTEISIEQLHIKEKVEEKKRNAVKEKRKQKKAARRVNYD